MKFRAIAITAAAIAAGAALTVLGSASPAVGYYSPPLLIEVEVQETATLVAKGAALEVRADVTCAGTDLAYLSVEVTQRAGGEIATGGGSTTVGCTGGRQTVIVLVTAEPGRAFKSGTAVAEAYMYGCSYGCGSETDTRTIDISK